MQWINIYVCASVNVLKAQCDTYKILNLNAVFFSNLINIKYLLDNKKNPTKKTIRKNENICLLQFLIEF